MTTVPALDPDQKQKLSLVLEAIQLHFETHDLKTRILKCKPSAISKWKDDYSLDLLHHCILENNVVALVLLLSQGHFKPPYEPANWPYLHLVACLGYRTFISSIIQDLKFHHEAILLDWKVYYAVIKAKLQQHFVDLSEADKANKLSPVDVAALFGHIGCVRLLLDFWQAQKLPAHRRKTNTTTRSQSLYLTLACQANSPNALRLLLHEHSDKKEALESAVRMGVPECVDVVLRDGDPSDMKKAFQGMNLFHVLYTYRSCRTPKEYEAMVEITSVLLRHNQNVNACRPSRTFPLYSLLSHLPGGCSMEQSAPYLIAALMVLVAAGADPNVDEILIEEKLNDLEQSTAFGRRPYSSAVNCLLCSRPKLRGEFFDAASLTDPADQYVYKCVEILLRHGADLGSCGKFNEKSFYDDALGGSYHEGTALHVLAATRVDSFTSYPILRQLLRYGVDADVRGKWYIPSLSTNVRYALNVFPFAIWTLPLSDSTLNPSLHVFSERDLKNFKYIMKFMSKSSSILAYREFLDVFEKLKVATDNHNELQGMRSISFLEDKMYETLVEVYEKEIKEPDSLQRCCSKVIWRSCRLHMGNVFELPIPGPLRNIILSFF